ncbi:LysM peptidoglycan-binding domain-containing protein [Falsibacillus pallidus]|uniref:LysM domain-containing protein n=1 Tax=Falsibacillus pallidus TaxID=493781 RepID=A0A370GH17_9BACI|nr:LysM peptidoglycan-binding domain-containing protein [Falsibacillus pallidus]RDI42957.1 LysM domain-containing protein [Falsibacillus pallidus]
MKTEMYRDQAARLRQKLDKVEHEETTTTVSTSKKSQLPPRSEHHRQKKTKTKWKLKFPLIRLLLLSFVLVPITIFGLYTYFEKHDFSTPAMENSGGEEIRFETSNGAENSAADEGDSSNIEKDASNSSRSSQDQADPPAEKGTAENTGSKEGAAENQESTPAQTTVQTDSNEPPESNQNIQVVEHTVQPNETIFRISMNYFHSKDGIEKIKEFNNLPSNEIEVGQVLKIPVPK